MEPEYLRSVLRYDPKTGVLTWKERGPEHGPRHKWFNSRYAGKIAMTSRKGSGHLCGPISGKTLMAHRVAWAVHYGKWPTSHIDHINGDPADNRIENIRLVTPAENAKNRRPNAQKASGLPHGVSQKRNGRYFAQIQSNGKNHHLGYFETPDEASRAYLAGKAKMGFHENHAKTPHAEETDQ